MKQGVVRGSLVCYVTVLAIAMQLLHLSECREHRCKCITMVCCCQCSNVKAHGKKDDYEESSAPYARLAALFSQARDPSFNNLQLGSHTADSRMSLAKVY